MYPRDDSFELGFNHLIVQANDLGLHVMDGQNGVVYLAHGEVLTMGLNIEASFTCRADDAIVRKDWGAVWLECCRLAPQRLPEALTVWALMVVQGRMAPPHPALGGALAQSGGTAPELDKRVRSCQGKGGFKGLAILIGAIAAIGVWRSTADFDRGAAKACC